MNDPFDVELTEEEQHADDLITADLALLRALIKRRGDLGLTQEDVAKAIGRDPSAVSRFERLDSDPHLSTVRRYARAVNADVKHIVSDRVPETGPEATFQKLAESFFTKTQPTHYPDKLISVLSLKIKSNTWHSSASGISDAGTIADNPDSGASFSTFFTPYHSGATAGHD